MFLSRTIAKQRMAANVRPSFVGAWGLVLADALALLLVFWLLYRPFQSVMTALEVPTFMIILALVLLVFIPIQAVLITSALWAAKSRWVDIDP
jgi:Na+/proline symporter